MKALPRRLAVTPQRIDSKEREAGSGWKNMVLKTQPDSGVTIKSQLQKHAAAEGRGLRLLLLLVPMRQ